VVTGRKTTTRTTRIKRGKKVEWVTKQMNLKSDDAISQQLCD
jgi:hypothetical protein